MSRDRTVTEKTEDAVTAFNILSSEITPPQFRDIVNALQAIPPATPEEGVEGFNRYVNAVNASLGIARVVMANDRAAMIAAAMLTQSGVSRPIIAIDEEA